MLKKSEVLKEGYIKGLQKAASEIERALLMERPMITQEMLDDGESKKKKKKKWETTKVKLEELLFKAGEDLKLAMVEKLNEVVKNPVGHDVMIYTDEHDDSPETFIAELDGYCAYFKKRETINKDESWKVWIEIGCFKQFVSHECKEIFNKLMEDVKKTCGRKNVSKLLVFNALAYRSQFQGTKSWVQRGPSWKETDAFISKMKNCHAFQGDTPPYRYKGFYIGGNGNQCRSEALTNFGIDAESQKLEDILNKTTNEIMGYSLADCE